jgi:hypothetical protein
MPHFSLTWQHPTRSKHIATRRAQKSAAFYPFLYWIRSLFNKASRHIQTRPDLTCHTLLLSLSRSSSRGGQATTSVGVPATRASTAHRFGRSFAHGTRKLGQLSVSPWVSGKRVARHVSGRPLGITLHGCRIVVLVCQLHWREQLGRPLQRPRKCGCAPRPQRRVTLPLGASSGCAVFLAKCALNF